MGWYVAMSGDGMTAVAGAAGSRNTYIFTRDPAGAQPFSWRLDAILPYSHSTSAVLTFVSVDDSGTVVASGASQGNSDDVLKGEVVVNSILF